jgi:hypothetical protein
MATMAKSAAERQDNCRSCEGWGFVNPRQGGNPRDFPKYTGPMIFCQCVKPTVHQYAHSAHGRTDLRGLPQGKHGPRLPSEKAAETRAHNQAKKAAAAPEKPQGRTGGFYGEPGVRDGR